MFKSEEELEAAILSYHDEKATEEVAEYFEEYLTLLDEGEWTADYKYQFCETIYKLEVDGLVKYYAVHQSRSGSYSSDYYYDDATICQVEPKETRTIKYVEVKKAKRVDALQLAPMPPAVTTPATKE